MQALIILRFAVYGGFRIMLTHEDAKMMARSLRDALGNRNVLLSHSDCLEIVARQFGLADWNTLVAKLPAEEERHTRTRRPDTASLTDGQMADACVYFGGNVGVDTKTKPAR